MLLCTATLFAQDYKPQVIALPQTHAMTLEAKPISWAETKPFKALAMTRADHFVVSSDNKGGFVLKIFTDGKVEVGEGVKPDEAAKKFLEALRQMAPDMLKVCAEPKGPFGKIESRPVSTGK